MLDRIAQAILTERRLTDEVAHELRTPLSVIRSEAQLAQLEAGSDAVPSESLEAIVAATGRMTSSIETMLAVTRSAHADEQLCHPGDVLAHVRHHAVSRPGVSLSVADAHDDGVVIAAPLLVVGAAVTPLLDNAVRHAESAVRVRVSSGRRRSRVAWRMTARRVDEDHRDDIFLKPNLLCTGGRRPRARYCSGG